MRCRRLVLFLIALCALAQVAPGVILLDSGDPATDSTTPGDNSGWQYEGLFNSFIGTPISPYFFITAKHIGGNIGNPLIFHGDSFTTIAVYPDQDANGNSLTDLQIWEVDHQHPFTTYAPLYDQLNQEPGQELHVFGRGTQRGAEVYYENTLRGWQWSTSDGQERWGRNIVTDIIQNDDAGVWFLIQSAFDSPGLVHEAHLSVGDSGGGLFILEDGLWRLAGINYAVDEVFTLSYDTNDNPDYAAVINALFDVRGYYQENADYTYSLITGDENVPTSFYCTQISSRLSWIETVISGNANTLPSLPTESYTDWEPAYFTPAQLADPTIGGPNADSDGDGVSNLLEFAFNLDPTFAAPAVMTAGTGLSGLPLIQLEQVATADTRLTVEFVRRTAASGSGITYTVQFAAAPGANAAWQGGGTEAVTAINPRWERVKVTDSASVGSAAPMRFARVLITQNSAPAAQSRARSVGRK